MAYNYMNSVNNILNYKSQWDAGDEDEKRKAHKRALTEYDNLIRNGYGDIADRLKASDTAMATDYAKSLNTAGKTHVRPYLVNGLTGKYGLSQQEADDLITWNPDTHEVNLGSINLGRGDAEYNGKSYFSDTGKLDKALEDWAASTGRNISPELRFNQLMNRAEDSYDEGQKYRDDAYSKYNEVVGWIGDDRKDLQGKYNDYIDWIGTPYYETGEYDRIMDQYRELGNNAGYSAIAGNAGSNSGNVDSYAAAQAARQLKSFENAGNAAARDWWTAKADKLLGGIGALADYNNSTYDNMNSQADRILNLQNDSDASGDNYSQLGQDVFNADQVAKNNEAQRDYVNAQTDAIYNDTNRRNAESEAEITGKTPMELDPLYKQIFDDQGNLREGWENRNFLALAQEAAANGRENDAAIYLAARDRKMADNWDEFGQFADDEVPDVQYRSDQTEAGREFDRSDDTERYGIDKTLEAEKYRDDTWYNITDRWSDAQEYMSDNDVKIQGIKTVGDMTVADIMARSNVLTTYLSDTLPAGLAALVTGIETGNFSSAGMAKLYNVIGQAFNNNGENVAFTENDFKNLLSGGDLSGMPYDALEQFTELALGLAGKGYDIGKILPSLVNAWDEVDESDIQRSTGAAGTAGGNSTSYLNNGATSSGGYSYLGENLDEEISVTPLSDVVSLYTRDGDGNLTATSAGEKYGLNDFGLAALDKLANYMNSEGNGRHMTENEVRTYLESLVTDRAAGVWEYSQAEKRDQIGRVLSALKLS